MDQQEPYVEYNPKLDVQDGGYYTVKVVNREHHVVDDAVMVFRMCPHASLSIIGWFEI